MNFKFCILFFIIIFILVTITLPAEEPAISFTYAFVYQSGDEEVNTLDPSQTGITLNQGDSIKLYFKPGNNTYIYLFYEDSTQGLFLLFPETIKDLDQFYQFGKTYSYPPGTEWAWLDESQGTDRFIFLVSDKRLSNLENVIKIYLDTLFAYMDNPANGTRQKMIKTRVKVLEIIKKLRLDYSQHGPVQEKLVVIAGEFRGTNEDEKFKAIKVDGQNFYTKIIRVNHNKN